MLFREFRQRDLIRWGHTTDYLKIPYWVEGGWGVDILLGEQTRWHEDLDVVIESRYSPVIVNYLSAGGFTLHLRDDTTPWNFRYGNDEGVEFDFHIIERDEDGNGWLGPERRYPARIMRSHGKFNARRYPCISPGGQVRLHTGYDVDEEDWRDVSALCERFKLKIPSEYDRFRTEPAR